jgi:hypothetical protein
MLSEMSRQCLLLITGDYTHYPIVSVMAIFRQLNSRNVVNLFAIIGFPFASISLRLPWGIIIFGFYPQSEGDHGF